MFEAYKSRLHNSGGSNRGYVAESMRMAKEAAFTDSQSYKEVYINGKKYDARILEDVSDTVKNGNGNYKIEFRPGVLFYPGTYIQIKNAFGHIDNWLIIDVLDDMFFPKSLIKKCNYNLKWKSRNGNIVNRWINFDDSYKLYDAIRNYGYDTNLPEGAVVITLPYDKETAAIGLDDRFIIDTKKYIETPAVYQVTNRSMAARLYDDDNGIIKLSLTQCQFNHTTDNAELMIADYYEELPIIDKKPVIDIPLISSSHVNIKYKGKNRIVMGTPAKEYRLEFTSPSGEIMADEIGTWEVNILPEFSKYITYEINDNNLSIRSEYNENLEGYQFRVVGYNSDQTVSAETHIKVVSGI